MNDCRRHQESLEASLAGTLADGDRAELDAHCRDCADCAGLLELHAHLEVLGDQTPLPDAIDLQEMRDAVLAATPVGGVARRSGFLNDLGRLWRAHPLPAGLATAAVLACAVFLGRGIPQERTLEADLLSRAADETVGRTGFEDVWDGPYSFANVSVRDRGDGELALSFDACRHVDLQVGRDSPLAREVLLHAILEPSSMGSRLQAMEITPEIRDDRLKDALIATMLNDPDAVVRINALAVLARYPFDDRSRDAYLQTLGNDLDVQMRLSALEELARRNVGFDVMRNAVGEDDPNGTLAILNEVLVSY